MAFSRVDGAPIIGAFPQAGETVGPYDIAGMVVILAGVAVITLRGRTR